MMVYLNWKQLFSIILSGSCLSYFSSITVASSLRLSFLHFSFYFLSFGYTFLPLISFPFLFPVFFLFSALFKTSLLYIYLFLSKFCHRVFLSFPVACADFWSSSCRCLPLVVCHHIFFLSLCFFSCHLLFDTLAVTSSSCPLPVAYVIASCRLPFILRDIFPVLFLSPGCRSSGCSFYPPNSEHKYHEVIQKPNFCYSSSAYYVPSHANTHLFPRVCMSLTQNWWPKKLKQKSTEGVI